MPARGGEEVSARRGERGAGASKKGPSRRKKCHRVEKRAIASKKGHRLAQSSYLEYTNIQ